MRYFTATITFQTETRDADVAAMLLGRALMDAPNLIRPTIQHMDPPESLERLRRFFQPVGGA